MGKEDYGKIELEQNGMQVILEFPRKPKEEQLREGECMQERDPKEEGRIEREVKQILADILREYWLGIE